MEAPITDGSGDGAPFGNEAIDPVWTAIRALLSSQTATTAALEHLCARAAHGDRLDPATSQRLLDAALDRHRRALEDVAFARRVLEPDGSLDGGP